jgi:hypothetical protein
LLLLRQWDPALADLEKAAHWSDGHAGLLARTTCVYAACLPARPDRLTRTLTLARQAAAAWMIAAKNPG